MLLEILISGAVFGTMAGLVAGPRGWRTVRDKLTKGKFIFEKEVFDKILFEFAMSPEEWRVDKDSIIFPAQGSYKIWIHKDQDAWKYSLNGGAVSVLPDYYANAFAKVIALEHAARLSAAASRIFTNERLLLK